MRTRFIEAGQGPNGPNWGKFLVAQFEPGEWALHSHVDEAHGLLRSQGWTERHLWVLDLATGEGAFFLPGGSARADLAKHRIWVCPLYEPFLTWLYQQTFTSVNELPTYIELPDAPAAMHGYRRQGTAMTAKVADVKRSLDADRWLDEGQASPL
jgi:hypothetical protein